MQMRDGDAPSYYNPVEASTLVRLLQGLLAYKTGAGQGVTVQDIGVIATYRNQVRVRHADSCMGVVLDPAAVQLSLHRERQLYL